MQIDRIQHAIQNAGGSIRFLSNENPVATLRYDGIFPIPQQLFGTMYAIDQPSWNLRYNSGQNIIFPQDFRRLDLRVRAADIEVIFTANLSAEANGQLLEIFGIDPHPEIALNFGLPGVPQPAVQPGPAPELPPLEIVPFCIALLNEAQVQDSVDVEYEELPFNVITQDQFAQGSVVYMVNDNPNSIYREEELRNWFTGIPGLGPRCRDPLTNGLVFNVTKVRVVV